MTQHDREGAEFPAAAAGAREVVGVFHDEKALEAAIDELLQSGFDRADISLLAGEEAVTEMRGRGYVGVAELEDDFSAARVAYAAKEDYGAAEGGLISGLVYIGALAGAGLVIASGGLLGSVILTAALSGGVAGAVGLVGARWLDRQRTVRLNEQLAKGGLPVWAHVGDDEHERRATEILRKHGADDVHSHTLEHPVAVVGPSGWVPYPPLLRLLESVAIRPTRSGG